MVTLSIDGKQIRADDGATILEAARNNGIEIPTLCHHEAVEPYGACRLCSVELVQNGHSRLVTACCYPVQEGLEVRTNSEKVINLRRGIVDLLLARCSQSTVIQDFARHLGIDKTDFKIEDNECILCGLCVRVCHEVVGVSAISLVNRGTEREVAPPFYEPSPTCIGCGSCAEVCPTHAIKLEDIGATRIISMPNSRVEFALQECKSCGKYFAPKTQIEYLRQKSSLPKEYFDICPDCMKGNSGIRKDDVIG